MLNEALAVTLVAASFDVAAERENFPILSRLVYGKPLVYLDNGASAQKPREVLDAVDGGLCRHLFQRPPRRAFPVQRIRPWLSRRRANPPAASSMQKGLRKSSSPRAAPRRSTLSPPVARRRNLRRRRNRHFGDGASFQHRALAFPARTQRRGARLGADCGRRFLRSRRFRQMPDARRPGWSPSPTCPMCLARSRRSRRSSASPMRSAPRC